MPSADNKRILKNTLALYIRMFLVMGVSLYTSRVVLNQLGVADYGVYNVVGGVVVMLSFFNGSMATATQRFLAYAIGIHDKELEIKTFSMAFFIHALIAIIMLILAETIGIWFVNTYLVLPPDSHETISWVYHFSVVTAMIGILTVPFTSLLIAHERMGAYAYISILEVCLKLAVALLLMFIAAEKLRLYAFLVFVAAVVVSATWIIYTKIKMRTCLIKLMWDKKLFREMFGFVGWQTLGQVSMMLQTQGVNILLNMFFGPILNAARGIAVQVNTAVLNFSQNFQTASIPQINKLYAARKLPEMHALIYKTSKLTFLLMFVISMPILIETEPILRVWLKIIPEQGVLFVRLMLLTALVNLLSGVLVYGALATGKIRTYQLTMVSSYIFDVVFVYAFFKFGMPAPTVFYVEMCFHLIGLGLRLYLLRKMIGLNPSKYISDVVVRELVTVAVTMLVVFCFKFFIPISAIGVLINMCMALLCAMTFSYFIALNPQERQWANWVISTTIHKFIRE